MTTTLNPTDKFPDWTLPNHENRPITLSKLTAPSPIDQRLKFHDGYPLIIVFYRGFYCPRDNVQMRQLVAFQKELRVNYCKMVAISVQPPQVQAAFRAGLGASWPFLSDEKRALIKALNILDETEGEYAYPPQPYTFVLRPDLTIYKIYNGWFYIGRPSLDELRQDLRTIMSSFANYGYESYTDPHVTQIRIPQQAWLDGAP
ncbi:MAG: peroxiredoxin family protein, partial [Chloroflexota bacterium]